MQAYSLHLMHSKHAEGSHVFYLAKPTALPGWKAWSKKGRMTIPPPPRYPVDFVSYK